LNNTLNNIWSNNYSDSFTKFLPISVSETRSINTLFNSAHIDNGEISFVTSKIWDGNLAEASHITSIGNIMYTSYSIWLILTSIILLLAMVGAIVITIKNPQQNLVEGNTSSRG
jgi:NADH-ubiquinone oxidoreductase chain 6